MTLSGNWLPRIHYASPFLVVTSATSLSAIATFFVSPSQRVTLDRTQRSIAKRFAAVIAISYLCPLVLLAISGSLSLGHEIPPDAVVYSTLNVLIWLVIALIYADANQVYRFNNVTTWAIALCSDTTICLLSMQTLQSDPFAFVELSIRLIRTACLTFLCISATWSTKVPLARRSERVPLLKSKDVSGLDSPIRESMCFESVTGTDGSNENGTSSEQQRRVEIVGGWWAYLHELKFLLPYILPVGDRRRRVYALVMFMLTLFERASVLLGPRLIGNIVRAVSVQDSNKTVAVQILVYIFAVKIPHDLVLEPARRWFGIRYFYGNYVDLLLSLASHVAGLSFEFHENKQIGEITAAIGQGEVLNKFVDDSIENTLPLILDIVVAFSYLTYLFDAYVGLILAVTYVLYGIVTYKSTILCAKARRKFRETSRIEWNVLHEAIANWMSTFYLNRQDYQHHRLETLTRQELQEQTRSYDLSLAMQICQNLIMCLGYCAVLLRAAHLANHTNDVVGDFVTLILYWSFFTTPLFKLAHFYSSLAQLLVDVEHLRQLMQIKPSVKDVKGARDLRYRNGKVDFRDVSFSYDEKRLVLDHINFTVEPGCTVAFVGHSGSGKTTTCDKLLFRAYDVTGGSISIDNQDIRSVTQRSLRETIGIVRQEPTFNNDTVLENVRYARLDASDEEVVAACKDAAIHDQIMGFPMAYNTRIGERGIKLSSGERQRLAIAQLFLRNPKIVVLDEATSSVDNVTESEIQESFARIYKGRTTIIIAHRLTTVQHVDQIFVLNKGKIEERGTHDELLGLRGRYFQLWAKTQKVKQLTRDLHQANTNLVQETDVDLDFIELSSDNDSDNEDVSLPDLGQLDGASSSKPSSEERTGLRRRIRKIREKWLGGADQLEHDQYSDDEEVEGPTSPIRLVSPRVTDTSPPPTATRSSQRRFSRGKKPSTFSSPTPTTKKIQTRNISAPMSPIHISSGIPQEPLTHHKVSTPDRAPVTFNPLDKPVEMELNSVRDGLLRSPQSPGRHTALRSHPVLSGGADMDVESSQDTCHSTVSRN